MPGTPPPERAKLLDWLSARLNLTEIFSLLTSYGLFHAEVDTRKPLREALAEALARPIPSYARWPRVLGLLVVVLLGVQVATGVLLSLYYLPSTDSAHESVGTLLTHVHFGWLVHQLHFWGSQLLIALLLVRLARFFFQRVYRAPRELLWVFGALLLLVVFHADLTGRLLPFTSPAYWSTVRGLEIVEAVPIYGDLVLWLVGGSGTVITDLTLIRFYVLHVALLPLAALALIYLHFSTVRRVGLTGAEKGERYTGGRAVRNHLLNLAIVLALLFGALFTVATLAPLPFHPPADPFETVREAGPPWYLLAPFGFLESTSGWLARGLAGVVLFLAYLAFLVLPFLDRARGGGAARIVVPVVAGLVFLLWLGLTWLGARSI